MTFPRIRRFSIACAGLWLAALTSEASAHGGIPRAYDIVFEPGNADHVILRSDVWGYFETRDGGDTWSWVCAEAYRGRTYDTQRRSLAILPGGAVLIANLFNGLQLSGSDSSCDFAEVADLMDEVVQDVVVTKDDGSLIHVATATGSEAGVVSKIWQSTDMGRTWSVVGTELPTDFSATTVRMAPSDEQRLYVSGKLTTDVQNGRVARSDDGGATWEVFTVPVNLDDFTARIAGIHPNDSEVVFFWMDHSEGGGGDIQPDQIWVSQDAAQTWAPIVSAVGNLPGFAFSPDASQVLISGPEDGLLSATVTDVLTSGSSAFSQTFDGRVWGLNWTSTGLYAGNDDFTAGDLPKFMFGVSMDSGDTFEPIMEICDVVPIDCPAGSFTHTACSDRLTEEGGFQDDYLQGPRCVPDGEGGAGTGGGGSGNGAVAGTTGGSAPDAGTGVNDTESSGGGCACTVPGERAASSPNAWLVAFGALVAFGRRRDRRR